MSCLVEILTNTPMESNRQGWCVFVRACVRASVRACVRTYVRACVRAWFKTMAKRCDHRRPHGW